MRSKVKFLKTLLKVVLGVSVAVAVLGYAGYKLFIYSLPTSAPRLVHATDLQDDQQSQPFSCDPSGEFNYAYSVEITIDSSINNQPVYASSMEFRTQLQSANDDIVKGVATDIRINEGDGLKDIEPVYFLTRVEASQHTVFTAYNDLGLIKQHPLAMISQVLKALSVGEEGEAYLYTYDPLQRTYRYRHQGAQVERASHPSTATFQQLQNLFADYKNQWSVTLGQDCMPKAVVSVERQGIASSGHGGYIRFRINAERIDNYMDIPEGAHSPLANANQGWDVKQVAQSEFETAVTTREEMWEIIGSFASDKNAARLIKAAQYMIDNVSVEELAAELDKSELADDAKRDLIFGLGISGHDGAEQYLIDAMSALPVGEGAEVDLNKVRMMVAMSGNGKATENAYYYLDSVLSNSQESNNVQSNALINMGSLVTQMANNGQSVDSLQGSLTQRVEENLGSANTASAILAAGNADLPGLDKTYAEILATGTAKERYAAATVLARDPVNYGLVISHIGKESSNLVVNAIISNMDVDKISDAQRSQLQQLASQGDADRASIINHFLGA